MPAADRKVLLRLPPGLLARVDEVCGGLSRNAWLVKVIGEKVEEPATVEGESDDE